ncbi:hypothetical protein T440DRAFT_463641 [Plenodomus tracheiphilus IPT5]|uniref:mRNA export factor GLE1 n=1 Tax=Plenodomus tracheiphilus IPT5 TaxID=1408161 RepID=A0A6A7BPW3_9PLEO|nr:hypothetical protein T440DRAFT_463641 [Plenodomus tracheiphilus IPT5]
MPARSGTSSSSMHTATSFSSSFAGGSPLRQSPQRNARPHRESIVRDPYDSPSRQMALEFNLRLSISDRDFNEKLDQAAAERARHHAQQLALAAEEHKRVLRSAELEIERLNLEQQQAHIRREEAQKREIERLRQEKARDEAEAHRRVLEAKQREEQAARQAVEHQKRLQETEARLKAQKEQEAAAERQKKDKDEADRKAHDHATAAQKAQQQQEAQQQAAARIPPTTTTPTQAAAPKPAASQASVSNAEQIHAKYLQLHAQMKKFRVEFQNEHKQKTSPLKGPVGDARREIRVRLGQITVERPDSVAAIKRLRLNCFDIALNTRGPMIDIRPYIISQPIPPLANEAEAAYPAFLLYVWICFEKSLLKQFEKEAASEDGRTIQEIGLIAASLLSDPKYMWRGIPLSDIILAKFHRVCPPLFGIRGNMNTAQGQDRLGWRLIDKNPPSAESYSQRLRGLGAGYAAMSLRSFNGKAPAIPMSEYWRALVSICNTPSEDLWPGHFALIGGLVRDYYKKFLAQYGVPARGVLRRAVLELPARAPARCKDAAGTVSVLAEGWKKERISLE